MIWLGVKISAMFAVLSVHYEADIDFWGLHAEATGKG